MSALDRPRRLRISLVTVLASVLTIAGASLLVKGDESGADSGPTTIAESVRLWSIGDYTAPGSGGVSRLQLFPTGEYLLTSIRDGTEEVIERVHGTFTTSDELIALKPATASSIQSSGEDVHLRFYFIRWGSCRLLVPAENYGLFLKAVSAGHQSPLFASPRLELYHSTDCGNQHLAGRPALPPSWHAHVLDHPVAVRLARNTVSRTLQLDLGTDDGIRAGTYFYSRGPGETITEYKACSVARKSCELVPQESTPRPHIFQAGTVLTTSYPEPDRPRPQPPT